MGVGTVQWVINGGFGAIVVWVIYALLKGNLVPKTQVDARIEEIRADRDARLAQAVEIISLWKEAAEVQTKAVAEMAPTLNDIKDNHKTILGIVQAMKTGLAGGGHRGD